jgi:hypothetical protein
MPYDSFLIDPFLLLAIGIVIVAITSRIIKWRWKSSISFLSVLTMIIFWGTSVSLFFDLRWTQWIWRMCGASSGRDWMVNSGVFHFSRSAIYNMNDGALLICGAMFALYPLWLKMGIEIGYILFGRHEKQTGAIGIL